MPTWTGVVIGWIVICTNATPPNARWGNPPLTMFATQAACIEADRVTQAWLARIWREARSTEPLEMTCWCQHVTPAKGGP
jgi:hypothetical protein